MLCTVAQDREAVPSPAAGIRVPDRVFAVLTFAETGVHPFGEGIEHGAVLIVSCGQDPNVDRRCIPLRTRVVMSARLSASAAHRWR
jgi:hypothetical protein